MVAWQQSTAAAAKSVATVAKAASLQTAAAKAAGAWQCGVCTVENSWNCTVCYLCQQGRRPALVIRKSQRKRKANRKYLSEGESTGEEEPSGRQSGSASGVESKAAAESAGDEAEASGGDAVEKQHESWVDIVASIRYMPPNRGKPIKRAVNHAVVAAGDNVVVVRALQGALAV